MEEWKIETLWREICASFMFVSFGISYSVVSAEFLNIPGEVKIHCKAETGGVWWFGLEHRFISAVSVARSLLSLVFIDSTQDPGRIVGCFYSITIPRIECVC